MPMFAFKDMFDEIVALLLAATAAGALAMGLRQPLLVAFIAVGILAGPSGLNLIRSVDQIHALAEMGLALLLFIVGLRLDLHLIRSMGRVALATGLGQVAFTSIGGFFIAHGLGMDPVTSLYVAVALTFSSTIIIVKLLSDKKEADSLHGRIALGLLIVQDILVVLTMVFLSTFSEGANHQPAVQVLLVVAKGLGLLVGTWIASFLIMPRLLPVIAKSSELLVLFGIAWALILAYVGNAIGFSKEIGAFLAGVSLASTPYRENLGVKLTGLRDFLLLFFFIEMGSRLNLGLLGSQVWSAIVFSIFVLVGNPIIMMIIMGIMGYRKRTSFLTGLAVAQISEFSLILIAMGVKAGHIGNDAASIVTLVGLVTIGLSTYMILYSQDLYNWFAPYLGIFERKTRHREDPSREAQISLDLADVLVFGLGSYGTGIAEQLESRGRRVMGIDFDPQAVRDWQEQGREAIFGDARDTEVATALPLHRIRWVVSSIRDREINTTLIRDLRQAGYSRQIAAAAYDREDAEALARAGSDLVLIPFEDAATQAVDLVFATEQQLARRAMDKLIEALADHYIVCGYGRMGQQIVKDLARHQVPCVVVEANPEQLPKLREHSIPHVEGKASEDEALTKAGIQRARGLIAVAASDEENVFIVLTAKVLNPNLFIVARSILEENEDKLRRAGADRVMSPYILGGRRMAAAVISPDIMDVLDLLLHSDGPGAEITSITVPAGSACIGKTLREVNLWERCGVTLLAMRKRGEDLQPNPAADFGIDEGDEFVMMGTVSQAQAARDVLLATD